MKIKLKLTTYALAVLAVVGFQGTARADLSISNSTTTTSWNQVNGQDPFYVSLSSANLTGFTGQGQPGLASGATSTALSETFTITNGAGALINGATNYALMGISIVGGSQPAGCSIHLYDVTANLTASSGSTLNGSAATYNFTANGDLLGNGNGLPLTNVLTGTDQILYNLSTGPNTQDQVVLGAGHTYAFEIWAPSAGSIWDRTSTADAGGQGMGSANSSLGTARTTISALGLAGAAPRTFTLALYGAVTSAPLSVNTSTNIVPTINYVVDDFSTAGVGPANPQAHDFYTSSNNYAGGQLTNVYANWFGGAFQSVAWDPASDANNNTNSGSLKISLNFSSANGQFVLWDQSPTNNFFALNLNASVYTNFQCDVRFAQGSASDSGTFGSPIFGHLRFGDRTASYGQDWFAAVDVAASNTNWVHVSASLNAISDQNLTNIQGFLIGLDEGFYGLNLNGPSTVWVDNIRFTGPAVTTPVLPPTLSLQPAIPGLRIFAGSSANTYDREELATVDSSQSWVGGSGVSYSFKILSYPANINQTHIFLVPSAGNANMGNAGTPNEFIEFQSSNALWMVINPGANGVTASVQWKTNLPNANPNQTALTITNSTAVGTWTLAFSSATAGTLTAPGASPVPFTITDPTVTTDFANPLVAYFGIQPNSSAGEGQFEDWGSISVTGVAGTHENENFVIDTTFNANNYWANNSAQATSIQLVTSATPYWINWTLPAAGYGLGTASGVLGSPNTPDSWMLPEYFNSYNDGNIIPGSANQGLKTWVLIPSTCLPTSDGNPGGPLSPNAFFKLFSPPLAN